MIVVGFASYRTKELSDLACYDYDSYDSYPFKKGSGISSLLLEQGFSLAASQNSISNVS